MHPIAAGAHRAARPIALILAAVAIASGATQAVAEDDNKVVCDKLKTQIAELQDRVKEIKFEEPSFYYGRISKPLTREQIEMARSHLSQLRSFLPATNTPDYWAKFNRISVLYPTSPCKAYNDRQPPEAPQTCHSGLVKYLGLSIDASVKYLEKRKPFEEKIHTLETMRTAMKCNVAAPTPKAAYVPGMLGGEWKSDKEWTWIKLKGVQGYFGNYRTGPDTGQEYGSITLSPPMDGKITGTWHDPAGGPSGDMEITVIDAHNVKVTRYRWHLQKRLKQEMVWTRIN